MDKVQDHEAAAQSSLHPTTRSCKKGRSRHLPLVFSIAALVLGAVCLALVVITFDRMQGLSQRPESSESQRDTQAISNDDQVGDLSSFRHKHRQQRSINGGSSGSNHHRQRRSSWSVQDCNTWRQRCDSSVAAHHHRNRHFVGARATVDARAGQYGRRMRGEGYKMIQWSYKRDKCIAQCAGLTDDGKYMEVAVPGVYNVHARFMSKHVFANLLGMALYVKHPGQKERAVMKIWRPATPVVLNGTGLVQAKMRRFKPPSVSHRQHNARSEEPADLNEHQEESLRQILTLHHLIALNAGDQLRVDAVHECGTRAHEQPCSEECDKEQGHCPLKIEKQGLQSAFEIFRV